MLVRFIVDNSEFFDIIHDKELGIIVRRREGFFKNKEIIESNQSEDVIIYTDDETILNYVPFVDGKYQIEFKFPECDKFIHITQLHPNLRRENDLTAMFHKGIFHEDFADMCESDWCD